MAKQQLFIVGLDDFNLAKLERLPQAAEYDFRPALDVDDIRGVADYDMPALLDKAAAAIEGADGPVAGVTTYWDFPGTVLVPMLAKRFGLPAPSLEAVLQCEHKFWSRVQQRAVIADHIPRFAAFDPFDENAYDAIGLLPPFWIKPFKSFRSFLAFHIHQPREFRRALAIIREREGFFGEPFRWVLEHADLPAEIAGMRERFIAESVIGGTQCTLEGYVHDGEVTAYGVIDSVREHNASSFSRYEYPSSLPLEVKQQLIDVGRAAIEHIGLDNSPFNIEFFYDQSADKAWLLEINPRTSQAHTDLFEKVHGASQLGVMVDIAAGRKPPPLERNGEFNIAAHFMFRVHRDGTVQRIPDQAAIDRLRAHVPGLDVKLHVRPGQRLCDLQGQDMYSYQLASVFVGGRDQDDLLDKYDLAAAALQFDIEP
jgi:hypothetical protein